MSDEISSKPVRTGESTVDAEHDVQLQLLDALALSIEKSGDAAPVKYVLEQFIEFTEMHFLSEQLVMRMHGYPGYGPHLEEHTRLMKQVREIRANLIRGDNAPSLELVQQLREWLLKHIASDDSAFGMYLSRKEGPAR